MIRGSWKFIGVLIVGLGIFAACEKPSGGIEEIQVGLSKDRAEVLTHLADNIIIPSYARFKVSFDDMLAASDTFEAAPSQATLVAFRSKWLAAYTEWQKVELFDVGPAESLTIRYFFNIYPTSVDGINSNINNPAANLELPTSFAAQGFPALDYLLNGIGNTDAEIVSFYTTDADASKRLAYIKRINTHMSQLLTQVIAGWNGSFRNTFIAKTGIDIGSSTSTLVNALTLHYERYIRSGKVGIPSGAMLNGVVAPEKVEAFYKKDLSRTLAVTAHQAFTDLFTGKGVLTGTDGPSLKTYLDGLEAKDPSSGQLLSSVISSQLDASTAKLNSLDANFFQQIQTNNEAAKDAYAELQKTVRLLKVDMTSAMSVTITYTDNDGD